MHLLTWSTVAQWYNASTLTRSPAQIDFLIFVPVFSIFAVLYLELSPRFMQKGKSHASPANHAAKCVS